MAEWISVKERLPEEMKDKTPLSGWSEIVRPSEDVLIWLKYEKRQAVAWFSHECHYWTSADEKSDYLPNEVSHWMTLPEPPQRKAKRNTEKPKRGMRRKSEKTNKSKKPFADYSWGDCQGEEGGPRRGRCEMGEA